MKTEYWLHFRHSRGIDTRRFDTRSAAETALGESIFDGDEDDFLGAAIVMFDNERMLATAVIDLLPAGREWARLAQDEAEWAPTQRVSWMGSVPARAA